MDPHGPAQPSIDTAYSTAGNPIDHNSREQQQAQGQQSRSAGQTTTDTRQSGDMPVPSNHSHSAVPSSLGYGAHDASGDKGDQISPGVPNTEAEQMRAPGEGDVYKAQLHKTGFGEQQDLASDLDRKKQEQQAAREAVQGSQGAGVGGNGVEVGAALGQTGGPAVVEGR